MKMQYTAESPYYAAAMEAIRCHAAHGVDLNPYSTETSRRSFERGFRGLELRLIDYGVPYHVGAAINAIQQQQPTRQEPGK